MCAVPLGKVPALVNFKLFEIMRMCNVIAFAGGVIAGGVIALMFAPKKGAEFRKDIKDKLYDMKKQMDESIAKCKEGCHCGEENVNINIEE